MSICHKYEHVGVDGDYKLQWYNSSTLSPSLWKYRLWKNFFEWSLIKKVDWWKNSDFIKESIFIKEETPGVLLCTFAKWNILGLKNSPCGCEATYSAAKLLGKITTSARKTYSAFISLVFSENDKKVFLLSFSIPRRRWNTIHETTHELHIINSLLGFVFIFYAFVHACIFGYYEN